MNIFYPSIVIVDPMADPSEIGWDATPTTDLNCLINKKWQTTQDLVHISNAAAGDISSRTAGLICTGFNIPSDIQDMSGISVRIIAQRNGRIADDVISLYNGEIIGDNLLNHLTDSDGHLILTNDTTYGGVGNMWNTALTIPDIINNPNFGVYVKFQSHPYFPHRCNFTLESISITIH